MTRREIKGTGRLATRILPLRSIALALVLLGLSAAAAAAHVRWFVDPNDPVLASFGSYSLTDLPVLIWIGIGVALISAAVLLDGRLPVVTVVPSKTRHDAMELLRIFTGMSLLLTAYGGQLIAPHLSAYGGLGTALVFLQALIGIMLIANRAVHHAAILTIILFLGAMLKFGFIAVFEYVSLLGIALFLLFNHVPSETLRLKLKPYSVDVLRIFTGISLVVLGVSEKLAGAVLGQAFIAQYAWNFMPALGFEWYTDQLFALSAGAMEVIFGIIMILGVVTRLNTLAIAAVMFASNIVFLITDQRDQALLELVGHMPMIATALILLLLGYGQRLKLPNPSLRRESAAASHVAGPLQAPAQ